MVKDPLNGFSWSAALEGENINDFLTADNFWGEGQEPENPGRQYWLNFVAEEVAKFNFKGQQIFRVLEIGFGLGVDYTNLDLAGLLELKYVEYYGAEVTPEFHQLGIKNMPKAKALVLVDGETLPYTTSFFDVVYMRHILEHQRDYHPLMREVFRVCKSMVFINFFIPLTENDTDEIKFDNVFYHNTYSKSLFTTSINTYGWKIIDEKIYKRDNSVDNIIVLGGK